MPVRYIARKHAHHWSLRVVNDDTGGDIEFMRLRKEFAGWAVWMEDRDRERHVRGLFKPAKNAPLKVALQAAKDAYFAMMREEQAE